MGRLHCIFTTSVLMLSACGGLEQGVDHQSFGDAGIVTADGMVTIEDGGVIADGELPADDLPPPGTCVTDKHCAGVSGKPMCQQGSCGACPAGAGNGATFVNEDILDGTVFKPGQPFTKRWRLRNSGGSTWSGACGYSFGHVKGSTLGGKGPVKLADLERVAPGAHRDFKVPMSAPVTPGTHRGTWQMSRGGAGFGTKVWVEIKVSKCSSSADCLHPTQTACQSDGSCAAPPCASSAGCKDPKKPYCSSGGCVQCVAATHCPATKPLCQQGTCVAPGTCGSGPKPVLGQTAWPVPTKKTLCQAFGNKISYQTCGFHTGIDICAPDGTPMLAIADGKVVHVGPMWYDTAGSGRGPHAVIIQHAPGYYSTYGHNKAALVKVGACVKKGQTVALMGNLGYSSGPHLHFEIVDGTPFTGNWKVPFSSPCAYYKDPMKVLKP